MLHNQGIQKLHRLHTIIYYDSYLSSVLDTQCNHFNESSLILSLLLLIM